MNYDPLTTLEMVFIAIFIGVNYFKFWTILMYRNQKSVMLVLQRLTKMIPRTMEQIQVRKGEISSVYFDVVFHVLQVRIATI